MIKFCPDCNHNTSHALIEGHYYCEDCDDLTADADCPECGRELTSDSNGNYYCKHCGWDNDPGDGEPEFHQPGMDELNDCPDCLGSLDACGNCPGCEMSL